MKYKVMATEIVGDSEVELPEEAIAMTPWPNPQGGKMMIAYLVPLPEQPEEEQKPEEEEGGGDGS